MLTEQGYDALTIDTVAARAGVHRTTVYRRWRDVGGLIADVFAAASGDRPDGLVRVYATAVVDHVCFTITDTGIWRPPRESDKSFRGRGLDLMRSLMHEVEVCPGDSGTTVHLQARIQYLPGKERRDGTRSVHYRFSKVTPDRRRRRSRR